MNLREQARGQPCYMRLDGCTGNPSSTVLCHIRRGGIAGIGQKPSDFAAIPCCNTCHDEYDRRTNRLHMTAEDLDSEALRALVQWLAWLDKNGKIKVV